MRPKVDPANLIAAPELAAIGLTTADIARAVEYVHDTLDALDVTLVGRGAPRLADVMELANLSAFIGNLFRYAVVAGSAGKFKPNLPHTYPDLLAVAPGCVDTEIKVALETYRPKGHLAKAGPHLTVHYVLANDDGTYLRPIKKVKNRGKLPVIWKVLAGSLDEDDFGLSNTKGDSGKTAVVKKKGMAKLAPVYFVDAMCPHPPKGSLFKTLAALFARKP